MISLRHAFVSRISVKIKTKKTTTPLVYQAFSNTDSALKLECF